MSRAQMDSVLLVEFPTQHYLAVTARNKRKLKSNSVHYQYDYRAQITSSHRPTAHIQAVTLTHSNTYTYSTQFPRRLHERWRISLIIWQINNNNGNDI